MPSGKVRPLFVTRFRRVLPALAAAACFGLPDAARADSAEDLLREGYQIAWGGFAAITTCVDAGDVYEIGPYLFVCDDGPGAFPFHFGTVYLVARVVRHEGRDWISTYLCIEAESGEDSCFRGAVYRR